MAIEHQVARKPVFPCKPGLVELSELITKEKPSPMAFHISVSSTARLNCKPTPSLEPSNQNGPGPGSTGAFQLTILPAEAVTSAFGYTFR